MRYCIHTELHQGILVAEVSGVRSAHETEVAEAAVDTWLRLAARCHEAGVERMLVHIRLSGALPTSATFASIIYLGRISWDPALRIAVMDHGDQSRRATEFACRMAASRGHQFAYFDDEAAAATWLSADA